MRTFLLFLGIAGFAVLANGQTSTAQGQFKSITAPGQRMTANSIERTGSTTWAFARFCADRARHCHHHGR
jgi:hypothetical protein